MTGQQPKSELLEVLEGPLRNSGLDLEDVEISTAGRKRLVRVLVDRDGGISLDEIADATTKVSSVLDASDVLGENPYTLEVTSPGLDRPLTRPRHWRRNTDRLVAVTMHDGQHVTGRVRSADEESATLDVDGTEQTVRYADVSKARVEVEFNRPAGAARRGGNGSAGKR